MRYKLLLGSVLIALTTPVVVNAESSEPFDIRETRWGMNRLEVYKSESWDYSVENGMRVYEGKLFDLPCVLVYQFEKDGLNSVTYGFPGTGRLEYALILAKLYKKYGEADKTVKHNVLWTVKKRTAISAVLKPESGNFIFYHDVRNRKLKGATEDTDF